jgi:hypothetical protein
MITARALRRHLTALGKELADNCYCEDLNCESDLYHPYEGTGLGVPPYGLTLVTPDGKLDEARNKEYIAYWWGKSAHLDEVQDQIDVLDDWAEILCVIEHRTGRFWRGTDFAG